MEQSLDSSPGRVAPRSMLLNPWPTRGRRSSLVRPRRSKAMEVPGHSYHSLIGTEDKEGHPREAWARPRCSDLAPGAHGPGDAWCSPCPNKRTASPPAGKSRQRPECHGILGNGTMVPSLKGEGTASEKGLSDSGEKWGGVYVIQPTRNGSRYVQALVTSYLARASQTHSRTHRRPRGCLPWPNHSGFSENRHREWQIPTTGAHTFLSALCGCSWAIKSCCRKAYATFNSLTEPVFCFL